MRLIRLVIMVVCTMGVAWAQSAASSPGSKVSGSTGALPDISSVRSARAAYNEGRYDKAAQGFKKAARQYPENPLIYRALARACTYAGLYESSVRAYRHYLTLAVEADDREKVEAELALVTRKLDASIPPGPPPQIKRTIERIRTLASEGRFTGEYGAIGALDQVISSDYVGPEIAVETRALGASLAARTDEAIEAWFRTDAQVQPDVLAELSLAWDIMADRKIAVGGASSSPSKIEGLIELSDNAAEKALLLFASSAPSDHRIRFAQSLALLKLKRNAEAAALLGSLSQGANPDPRFEALLALIEIRMGKTKEGQSRLRELLEVE